jgi:NADPH:quinone reductase-like Zn-dependent oxidoreductase
MQVVRSTVVDAPIDHVWPTLRDFNSHALWHPAVAESVIEDGQPPDEVGCVRRFRLRSGEELREQLLSLSDRERRFTYCILDSPLPLIGYVATVTLRSVTDGDRTFWDWRSSFAAPPGREEELARLVAEAVYEAGFDGLRAFLRRGGAARLHSRVSGAAPRWSRASIPAEAIVIRRHGGPDELVLARVEAAPPAPGEVRIRHTAIGLNYLDVYMRTGQSALLTPPGTPGVEAAGEVLDTGEGVSHLLPGDRVAYACPPVGAYATVRTMRADQVVPLPPHISDEVGAAILLKGMTAEYLLRRVHRIRRGVVVLVHAAAGGVGLLLCQWARHLGATVIGTVSTEEKARLAREAGCDYPIVVTREDFVSRVRDITSGRGADVVYDGVGAATMTGSLEALAPRSHLVSYGHASGAPGPVEPALLSAKSASMTCPVLFHFTEEPDLLRDMSRAVFRAVDLGILRVVINHRYPLGAAAEAHRDLEGRRTTGSVLLMP